jgi:hypothetical protein
MVVVTERKFKTSALVEQVVQVVAVLSKRLRHNYWCKLELLIKVLMVETQALRVVLLLEVVAVRVQMELAGIHSNVMVVLV